jgi:hypothetical protein
MIGAGKYDEACTKARQETKAAGVILVVIGGEHGHGFSAQIPPPLIRTVPNILRSIADQIEKAGANA